MHNAQQTNKLTSKITANELLNKFIIYKYKSNSLYIYYIYNTNDSNNILAYEVFCNNKREFIYCALASLSLYLINSHIYNTSLDYCVYEIYTF